MKRFIYNSPQLRKGKVTNKMKPGKKPVLLFRKMPRRYGASDAFHKSRGKGALPQDVERHQADGAATERTPVEKNAKALAREPKEGGTLNKGNLMIGNLSKERAERWEDVTAEEKKHWAEVAVKMWKEHEKDMEETTPERVAE